MSDCWEYVQISRCTNDYKVILLEIRIQIEFKYFSRPSIHLLCYAPIAILYNLSQPYEIIKFDFDDFIILNERFKLVKPNELYNKLKR